MPAKGEEGHAVDRFDDHTGRPEVGQAGRHPNCDVGVGEGRVELLQGAHADCAARDHQRADVVCGGDGPDVVDAPQHGEAVDRVVPGATDIHEPLDVKAHPGPAPEAPGQGACLLVAAGDEGRLGGDAARVKA